MPREPQHQNNDLVGKWSFVDKIIIRFCDGALTADGIRQDAADQQHALLAEDPAALDHLRPYQQRDHLDRMREMAIDVHRETMTRNLVREHRLPGQRYAVQRMRASHWERLDELARRAGFGSIEDAIRETSGQSLVAAARRIGIGASTVARWREKLRVNSGMG